jgi:hypothetical protein
MSKALISERLLLTLDLERQLFHGTETIIRREKREGRGGKERRGGGRKREGILVFKLVSNRKLFL